MQTAHFCAHHGKVDNLRGSSKKCAAHGRVDNQCKRKHEKCAARGRVDYLRGNSRNAQLMAGLIT